MANGGERVGQAVVGGLIAIYVVAQLLAQAGLITSSASAAIPAVAVQQIDDLHDWHNQRDADGVLLWWVPRSLSDSIEKQTEATRAQTRMIERLIDRLEARAPS